MKKVLLSLALGLSFSTATVAQEKDVKDLYFFQIKSGNKVLTEFEQKILKSDVETSDFSYQNKTKYYKDCRSDKSEAIEINEGAQGLLEYSEELESEQLYMSFDINSSRKIGLCKEPKMENFEFNVVFPFLLRTEQVKGSLGNTYTVNIGKVQKDQKTGKVIYPKFDYSYYAP